MKINPTKFLTLLDQLTAHYSIDPIQLTFSEDVNVNQMDATRTIGVYATIDKAMFSQYQPIGSVLFNVEMIKRLGKFFKGDENIDIILDSNKIKFQGSVETFEADLPNEPITPIKSEFVDSDYGRIVKKITPRNAYYIDPNELKTDYGEKMKLIYSPDSLIMKIHEDVFRYDKNLRTLKKSGNENGQVILNSDIINSLMSLFKGPIWVVFTDGPIEICYKEIGLNITYLIAPITTE